MCAGGTNEVGHSSSLCVCVHMSVSEGCEPPSDTKVTGLHPHPHIPLTRNKINQPHIFVYKIEKKIFVHVQCLRGYSKNTTEYKNSTINLKSSGQ